MVRFILDGQEVLKIELKSIMQEKVLNIQAGYPVALRYYEVFETKML